MKEKVDILNGVVNDLIETKRILDTCSTKEEYKKLTDVLITGLKNKYNAKVVEILTP